MNKDARAKEILSRVTYVTIATASKAGAPWCTPVMAAIDERCNVYWTSLRDTQHSQNLAENPQAYASVYEPTVCEKDGVYIQGRVEELSEAVDINTAALHLFDMKGKTPRDASEFTGESARRMYRLTPERVWISLDADAKVNPATSKTELFIL